MHDNSLAGIGKAELLASEGCPLPTTASPSFFAFQVDSKSILSRNEDKKTTSKGSNPEKIKSLKKDSEEPTPLIPSSTFSTSFSATTERRKRTGEESRGLTSLLSFFLATPALSIPREQLWKLASQMAVDHQEVPQGNYAHLFLNAENKSGYIRFLEELLSETGGYQSIINPTGITAESNGRASPRACGGRHCSRRGSRSTSRSRTDHATKQRRNKQLVEPNQSADQHVEKDYLFICRGLLAATCLAHPSWMLSLEKPAFDGAGTNERSSEEGSPAASSDKSSSHNGIRKEFFSVTPLSSEVVSENVLCGVITNVSVLVNLIIRCASTVTSHEEWTKDEEALCSSLSHHVSAADFTLHTAALTSTPSCRHKTLGLEAVF